jgi:hypothetical protein
VPVILVLNAYHGDLSAAIIVGGKVAAKELSPPRIA